MYRLCTHCKWPYASCRQDSGVGCWELPSGGPGSLTLFASPSWVKLILCLDIFLTVLFERSFLHLNKKHNVELRNRNKEQASTLETASKVQTNSWLLMIWNKKHFQFLTGHHNFCSGHEFIRPYCLLLHHITKYYERRNGWSTHLLVSKETAWATLCFGYVATPIPSSDRIIVSNPPAHTTPANGTTPSKTTIQRPSLWIKF